jgi:hypothetical protein
MLIATKMDIEMQENEKIEILKEARAFAQKVGIGFSAVRSTFSFMFSFSFILSFFSLCIILNLLID